MFNCFITLNLLLIAIHTKHFCLNQTAYWWKYTPFRLPRSVERVPIKRLLPNQASYLYQRCLTPLHLPLCMFSVRLVERKKAAVKRCEEQLLKMEVQATDREENKQIALGTSKLNYLDPRITVAWWVNINMDTQPWCLLWKHSQTLVNTESTQTNWVFHNRTTQTTPMGMYLKVRLLGQLSNSGLPWAFQHCEAGSLLISVNHHGNLSYMAKLWSYRRA